MSVTHHQFNVDSRKYFDILKKQKGFVLIFCVSAILSSLALTYIVSEKYQSFTTIYYRPMETSLLRQKNTESFGAPVPAPPFKVISQTLRDIVRSEIILRPVVEVLNLDWEAEISYPNWYENWYHQTKDFVKEYLLKLEMLLKYGRIIEEDAKVEAINRLRKNVDIKATKDSYVYILVGKAKYPERAARIVDTIGKVLVDWMREQDQNPASKRQNQLEIRLSEQELKTQILRKDREILLNNNNIVSIDVEASRGVESLYEMELETFKLNSEIGEKKKRVIEIEREIQKNSKIYVNPDDLKRMKSEKLFETIGLKGLIEKKSSLQSSIWGLKARLQSLPSLQKKIDGLDMKIQANTREYQHLRDLYLEAYSQATTLQHETRVLHAAMVPSKPIHPIKIYHVGLTAVLGLFFSVGLVYFLAYFNVRILFHSKGVNARPVSSETLEAGKSSRAS